MQLRWNEVALYTTKFREDLYRRLKVITEGIHMRTQTYTHSQQGIL
jgi:hypothetical protein